MLVDEDLHFPSVMQIIPVVDLMDARAVAASKGQRANYGPLSCPFCRGGDPQALVTAYLRVYPFRTLYVADIDAILGRPGNDGVIRRIRRSWPDLNMWIDSGLRGTNTSQFPGPRDLSTAVFGTESLRTWNPSALPWERSDSVLSLDIRAGRLLGPPQIWQHPETWPRRVIVMTLAQVGTRAGPDFPALKRVIEHSPKSRVYAAGGVRGQADLERLSSLGVAGALVATAIHTGQLGAEAIAARHD
jgi:phosphoribosylformimino-5-aminoimidazole carboxamide ribotide isomerase